MTPADRLVFNRLPVYLIGVVALALLLRLIVVALVVKTSSLSYSDFSWEMGWTARSIFLGHGFSSPFEPTTGPTALVPPLYPYLIALTYKLFGLNSIRAAIAILSFNSFCSALTCVPLYFLMQRALNRRVARLAALAWAIYPFSIYFSADRVWDYALTGLLFTCCLWAAQVLPLRSKLAWFGFGVLYGITALSNPSVVSLLPCLLVIALYRLWCEDRTRTLSLLAKGLLASLAFFAVCTPWNLRNEHALHSKFFLRDGFWLEFYAGNNGDTSESNSKWAHPASNPAEMQRYQQLGEINYIAEKRVLAIDFAKRHPLFLVEATGRRILRFWTGFWSFSPAYLHAEPLDIPNVPFCIFLCGCMLVGLRRWWKEDRAAAMPFLIALLVFPLPYYLTHSSMDYRQPIEPIMIVLVTIGLFDTRCRPYPQARTSGRRHPPTRARSRLRLTHKSGCPLSRSMRQGFPVKKPR